MKPVWKFRIKDRAEIAVDPVESEFFIEESIGGLQQFLVRESIQNAIDAKSKIGKSSVKVRFALSTLRGEHNDVAKDLLKGLRPHILARENGLTEIPDLENYVNVLVIEDFGTTGLIGDPEIDFVQKGTKQGEDFYYFWRNVGRSGKSEKDLGRWGLGKTVFPAASSVNAFFGYTKRETDGATFLMGQSVLKNHSVDGKRYNPYGFFALYSGGDNDAFPLPIRERTDLDKFKHAFSLKRDDETGLSIVVLYPPVDFSFESLVISVIKQYFYPILRKELEVSIESINETLDINSSSIKGVIQNLQLDEEEKQKLLGLYEFALWTISINEEGFYQISEQEPHNRPTWSDRELLNQDDLLKARKTFEEHKRIGFSVPVYIHPVDSPEIQTRFLVYLERNDQLRTSEDHFIRGGITIAGLTSRNQSKVRSIVVIDKEPLTTFLGDSENPSHTKWTKDALNFKGRYLHGSFTISFVKGSPSNLLKLLTETGEQVDFNLLADIFTLEEKQETGKTSKPKKKKHLGPPDLKPSENLLDVFKIAGGFKVKPSNVNPGKIGLVTLRVAYDVRRGNPFAKYSPFDFVLNRPPIRMRYSKNIDITNSISNLVEFNFEGGDFTMEITGFDPKRDLKVDARVEEK